jgi:hypothetical protein
MRNVIILYKKEPLLFIFSALQSQILIDSTKYKKAATATFSVTSFTLALLFNALSTNYID